MNKIIRMIKSFILPLKVTGSYAIKRPFTVMYPKEPAVVKDRWRGFHQLDYNKCIGCGLCGMTCPNKCIDYIFPDGVDPRDKKNQRLRRPAIDWGHCIFCGLCVEVCPTGALRFSMKYWGHKLNRLDLIMTPEEYTITEGKKGHYENILDKVRKLMQTHLLSMAAGGEWEEILRKLEDKWIQLYYDRLDGKLSLEEWDKKAREIEELALKIMEQVNLP